MEVYCCFLFNVTCGFYRVINMGESIIAFMETMSSSTQIMLVPVGLKNGNTIVKYSSIKADTMMLMRPPH